LPIELVQRGAFKGGGVRKKVKDERGDKGGKEEAEEDDEVCAKAEGGENEEEKLLSPALLTPKQLAATKSVYILDQLKRMSVDTPSFLYCMQKMNFIGNIKCGRYEYEHVLVV
jgi:hypothetical protein